MRKKTNRPVVSRRNFIGAASGALAGAPMIVPSRVLGQARGTVVAQAAQGPPAQPASQQGVGAVRVGNFAPSDTIVFGGIGVGGRGSGDLRQLLGDERVRFVAIADVQEQRRERIKSAVDGYYKNSDCVMYRDAAELMARKDIQALLISTSDRWHAHMAIWAAQCGKDMYCEKPAAMSIMEAYALAENCRRYGVVYQSGCQRRHLLEFEFAVGLARSGKLGRLLSVHADTTYGQGAVDIAGHGWWPASTTPPNPLVFDWEKWLGPCLWRPYNPQYPLGEPGRGDFWDFHAGLLEWGSHTVAPCQWAADMEHTEPIEYAPEGRNFRGDGLIGRYTITCKYATGVQMVVRNHSWVATGSCKNRFEGTEGWVEVGDGGAILVSDNLKSLLPTRRGPRLDPTNAHIQDFLDCIKSRLQPRANAQVTAHTHVAAHAAFIAAQLNRKITWDPMKRQFNDEEANRMRSRAYREPWRLEALSNLA
jgi:predicted dehydrogenase